MMLPTLPNLGETSVLAKPLPSTRRQHAVTAVFVALFLGVAFLMDIVAGPDINPTLAFVIPVLIGLVRVGPRGMRVVVALTLGLDLTGVAIRTPTSFVWVVSYAALTVICYLGLRFCAQREEIFRLNAEAAARTTRAEGRERQMIELVDTLYHEVRQPLAMAQMHVDAAREASIRGDQRWAETSMKAVDEALSLTTSMIKDLVESARLEAGQSPPKPIAVEVAGFVATFLGDQRGTFDVGRIHVEAGDDAEAIVDPRHLERCLVNLLSNALKYSGDDKPITLRVSRTPREVIVSVVDAGIGITTEEIPHLFDRGYRAPEAVRMADGTGLGLYIVQLLLEANHGRIWVESTPGKGSAFHLALPVPEGVGVGG